MIKYLTALFLLLAALQPAALQACDMSKGQAGHEHSAMLEAPAGEHDCCDSGPGTPADACDGGHRCGTCPVSWTVITPDSSTVSFGLPDRHLVAEGSLGASVDTAPPLRPPIA